MPKGCDALATPCDSGAQETPCNEAAPGPIGHGLGRPMALPARSLPLRLRLPTAACLPSFLMFSSISEVVDCLKPCQNTYQKGGFVPETAMFHGQTGLGATSAHLGRSLRSPSSP